jgi:hypothetical protein
MSRKIPTLLLACCFFLLHLASQLSGRPTQQNREWSRGRFELPAEIANIEDASELQPFLTSSLEFTRMAAARRLAQIEGIRAIPALLEAFAGEKTYATKQGSPLVKLEVIRALGQLGTEQSKSALLDILRRYWQNGPSVEDKRGYRLDRDFANVVDVSLRTAADWGEDPEVFELLESIALSRDVREYYIRPRGLAETAWEAYLKSRMKRQGITKEEASILYLLDFMYERPRPIAYGTFEHIRYRAASAVLQEYAESALSAVVASLAKDVAQEEAKRPDEIVPKRIDELLSKVGYLNGALHRKPRRNGSPGDAASQEESEPSPDTRT